MTSVILPPITVNITAKSRDALGNDIVTFNPPWYQALFDLTTLANTIASAPTGAAGGDLSGTYPNPTVVKINGIVVDTTATSGNILVADGTKWNSVAQSGDVTFSIGGVSTIGANKVTAAKFRQSAASSLVGNPTGGAANVSDITLGSTLTFSGTALQTLAFTGDCTASANSFVTTVVKIQGVSVSATNATAVSNLTGTNSGDQTITLTGDVTGSGAGSFAATIASNAVTTTKINNAAVTYTKIQNVTDARLLGRNAGSGGSVQEISLGTNLSFSGTTLNASGGGASPLTTKGDIYTFTTADARLAVASGDGKFLQVSSGTATGLAWSTSTIPTSAGATANKVLLSDGTNYILSTPTFPNASASSGKFIRSDGTNWIASTPTLPTSAGSAGKILVSDGTNYVESTPTFPYSASATSRKIIVSDGTNWVASTETYATPGTSGNVMTSNGTNWVSSAPVAGNPSIARTILLMGA